MDERMEIATAKDAADHQLVLAFGRLQGAANRLEYILGRALERGYGISHVAYEALLILGRVGDPGLSMPTIAQEQVLTTGGVTRLVDRMEEAGLVRRVEDREDRLGRLVRLIAEGAEKAVAVSRVHVENILRYFLEPLPAVDRERFAESADLESLGLGHAAPPALSRGRGRTAPRLSWAQKGTVTLLRASVSNGVSGRAGVGCRRWVRLL